MNTLVGDLITMANYDVDFLTVPVTKKCSERKWFTSMKEVITKATRILTDIGR
jgi:hypothetical protein